jgi:hypothetical protein
LSLGLGVFHAALMLASLLGGDDAEESHDIDRKLKDALDAPEQRDRLAKLDGDVKQAKGDVFYNISFRVNYSGRRAPPVQHTSDHLTVTSVEISSIELSKQNIQVCSAVDRPSLPSDKTIVQGGGYSWVAHRTCTTSLQVPSGEQIEQARARARRQNEARAIGEKLRKLVPPEEKKPDVPTPGPARAPSLLPQAPAPELQLLPGAPPPDKAAAVIQGAKALTDSMVKASVELDTRLHSQRSPSDEERQAYFRALARWKLSLQLQMNNFHDNDQVRNALGELLDRWGPPLGQTSVRLGGQADP